MKLPLCGSRCVFVHACLCVYCGVCLHVCVCRCAIADGCAYYFDGARLAIGVFVCVLLVCVCVLLAYVCRLIVVG